MGFNTRAELLAALDAGKSIINDKKTVVFRRKKTKELYKSVYGKSGATPCDYTFPDSTVSNWSLLDYSTLPVKSDAIVTFDEIPLFGGIAPEGNYPYWKALKGKRVRMTIETL